MKVLICKLVSCASVQASEMAAFVTQQVNSGERRHGSERVSERDRQ